MFFKNLVVPSMPPSFVKFSLKLSSVMIAEGDSIPRSDHVPQLRYAYSPSAAGTAATAEPVSCPATATTGIAPRPVASCTCAVKVPTTVPGRVITPNFSRGMSSAFSMSLSRSPVTGFSICDVEATVYSHTALPVSIYMSASGMNSILSAASRAEQPFRFNVSSWKSELKSMNWMPVRSYTSEAGIFPKNFSCAPAVCWSR